MRTRFVPLKHGPEGAPARGRKPLHSSLAMSSVPPPAIPTHTVLGARAQGEQPLAAQQFHLVLLDTERAGSVFPLTHESLRIGKAQDNDLVLDHPTVSRNHLVVRRQGDRFLVQDLGSTNGTYVNDRRLDPHTRQRLFDGDELRLASTVRARVRRTGGTP